jgi:hypothetical protein
MPTWRFEDDCLAPERRLRIDYIGPNPFKACQIIGKTLKKIFELGATDLWERDFRWDITSDPRTFYMRVYANKDIDQYTKMFIEVTIQGEQPVDEKKNGKMTIFIGGRLRTEYELNTAFKRSPLYKGLRWLYHMYFYSDVRRKYLVLCNELINKVVNQLKEEFKLPISKVG